MSGQWSIRHGCFDCGVRYGCESKWAINEQDWQTGSNHCSYYVTYFVPCTHQYSKPKLISPKCIFAVLRLGIDENFSSYLHSYFSLSRKKIAVNINIFCRADYFILTIFCNNCFIWGKLSDHGVWWDPWCVQIRATIFRKLSYRITGSNSQCFHHKPLKIRSLKRFRQSMTWSGMAVELLVVGIFNYA